MARKRRKPGRPKGGSEQIVQSILEATLVELKARGYHALRVEDVAARAGVAKTSIYRRWSTKANLVISAWDRWRTSKGPRFRASGDLRKDLIRLMIVRVRRVESPIGRTFLQTLSSLDTEEAVAVARRLHEMTIADFLALGLAPAQVEPLVALVHYRMVFQKRPLRRGEIARAVDDMLRSKKQRQLH